MLSSSKLLKYNVNPGEVSDMKITKIVITGGPCAGKSTAMSWIQNAFSMKGYTVLFIPETATELISGGVAPWTTGTNLDYQKCQMRLQLEKERIFEKGSRTMPADKILLVCDRGAMDNRAYMNDEEFAAVLEEVGSNEVELRDSYDAVFHLVTAAKGAVSFYTTDNNAARRETPEEACALDDRLIAAWTGHPHFRLIDNSSSFEQKMLRLISEISSFLGEEGPYETERSFLIGYPDLEKLSSLDSCRRIDIIQTYLEAADQEEIRLRQRGADGNYIYYETIKRKGEGGRRVQIERRLTHGEYLDLMLHADTRMRQIRKTRYCLTYENQYFEIDVYPFWNDRAIVEIELMEDGSEIRFPDWIRVIREVTDDEEYRVSTLARI